MLYALLCSLWGTIFVYQGEELGLTNAVLEEDDIRDPLGKILFPEYVGRDGSRTPIPWVKGQENAGFTNGTPWLPVDNSHYNKAVDVQEDDPHSMLNFVRGFLKWRKAMPGLISGPIQFHDAHEPVLIFTRGDVICYFNLGNEKALLPLPYGEPSPLDGHGLPYEVDGASLILPAFGVAFFKSSAENA